MTSPVEAVRQQTYDFLADPLKGLNPTFSAECRAREISVPTPGSGGSALAPFDFSDGSANVFEINATVDTIASIAAIQYPCLILSGSAATQSYERERIFGSKFFGTVAIEILTYFAWSTGESVPLSEIDGTLDALESSLIQTLNRDSTAWQPVLYSNQLDIRERTKLGLTNNNELIRCGIRASVTARYIIP